MLVCLVFSCSFTFNKRKLLMIMSMNMPITNFIFSWFNTIDILEHKNLTQIIKWRASYQWASLSVSSIWHNRFSLNRCCKNFSEAPKKKVSDGNYFTKIQIIYFTTCASLLLFWLLLLLQPSERSNAFLESFYCKVSEQAYTTTH